MSATINTGINQAGQYEVTCGEHTITCSDKKAAQALIEFGFACIEAGWDQPFRPIKEPDYPPERISIRCSCGSLQTYDVNMAVDKCDNCDAVINVAKELK